MTKDELERAVLSDPGIQIYACGRQDIASGAIDKRVLAVLAFLSRVGLKPTVSALECGHSEMTVSGYVSEHYTGDARGYRRDQRHADRQPPGAGTIRHHDPRAADVAGEFVPPPDHQPDAVPGRAETRWRCRHWNHIHVGFRPTAGEVPLARHYRQGPRTRPAPARRRRRRSSNRARCSTTQWNELVTRVARCRRRR